MAIISNTFGLLGQEGVTPRRVQMVVTDSLASITTAGYLQFAGVNTNQIQTTDIFDIIYLFSTETHTGTYGEFVPSFSPSLVITLVQVGGSTNGTVDTGTANDLAYYEVTGTTVSPLSTADNAVLITSGAGVPSLSHLIPSAVQLQIGSFDSGTGASSSSFWRGDGQWVASPGSGTVNTGTINDLAFYASTGVAVSPLTTADNGVLVTSVGGVPSISSTLPSELTIPSPRINQIDDTNGNEILGFVPAASAVNFIEILNNATGHDPGIIAAGADSNLNFLVQSKGTGYIALESAATSIPLVIASGTGLQHSTSFSFANTAIGRTVTFPDADGIVAFASTQTSWTPTFTFDTPGDLSVIYSTQTGSYQQIGNIIYFAWALIATPTFTTSSGAAEIAGFPMTTGANNNIYNVINSLGVVYTGQIAGAMIGGNNMSRLVEYSSTNIFANLGPTNFISGTQFTLFGQGFYFLT